MITSDCGTVKSTVSSYHLFGWIGRKGMATYQDLCDHVFSYAILATRILGVHPKEFLIFGLALGLFP